MKAIRNAAVVLACLVLGLIGSVVAAVAIIVGLVFFAGAFLVVMGELAIETWKESRQRDEKP
jgi:fatty acid desaturase